MLITPETGISNDSLVCLKERMYHLVSLGGVEFLDEKHDQEFMLVRQSRPDMGPYQCLTSSVRFGHDQVPEEAYESVLVSVNHTVHNSTSTLLLPGTRFGMTSVQGSLKYAWMQHVVPVLKVHTPEAQPETELSPEVREDFRLWWHETRAAEALTDKLLALALREIELIAEMD